MALNVDRYFGDRYPNTEFLKTTHNDYSHWFGCSAPAKYVIWKSVKQLRRAGNVNIPRLVHWSTVVTKTGVLVVRD
jgi:hypothetical protein